MDSTALQVGLLLLVLFLVERLASARGWAGVSAAGVPLVTWLVVSALAVWCEAVLAFVILHVLLFTLGSGIASAGLALAALLLAGTPIATWYLLRRRARQRALRG